MTTLILTHEQADFDAIASLWAAHRLHPSSVPVLPRRVNRNVRAYLDDHAAHYDFTESGKLTRRRVTRTIVVDTASAASIKGVSDKTEVVVIDHHQPAPAGRPTGATITMLVEQLVGQGLAISPEEASLFLLGLYEDTGALTYLTTTPRDARAAALLLEAGAKLDVVRRYLNRPLTAGQLALYDKLLAAARALTIDGHTVLISAIDGGDTDEELSTLSHLLRDTLDTAAVFLLVGLKGKEPRVQLIARSTTRQIDVGAVAAHFGGGGHVFASAALIHGRTLQQVDEALQASLPAFIQPPITVAHIMSRGVQTLSPDATVQQAAKRMAKYGYEGYPVVANGSVVGLVTRRAVDRAMAHHLADEPISVIMDSGNVTVSPQDSIEHLQAAMTAHGWGQVPVTDAGEVIGVVTRTDLIKRLSAPGKTAASRNLADAFKTALSPGHFELLQKISGAAAELDQSLSLFIVGGFVRDLLLNVPSQDFDIVVEGNAIDLAAALAKQFGGRVTSHRQFGTAKWRLPGGSPLPYLDFVSSRTEFYAHPSALPEVEHGNIKLDLHRRDFTINTLAICLDRDHFGDLLDFWGGERDLREKLIRVMHSISFVDDPTRILRAARFEQRFGFDIETRTMELLANALPLLHRVSGDRLRHELLNMLNEAEPARHLERLAQLGILAHIHPALTVPHNLAQRFAIIENLPTADKMQRQLALLGAWLADMPANTLQSVMTRLKSSAKLAESVMRMAQAVEAFSSLAPEAPLSHLHGQFAHTPQADLRIAVAVFAPPPLQVAIRQYLEKLPGCKPITTGDDLKSLGLQPGPRYREILQTLQNAYLDGKIATPDEERQLLQQLVE